MLTILCKRAVVVAALCMATVGAARAGTIWYLSGVTFEDGTAVTGSFEFDAATNLVGAYNIATQAGAGFSAFTYTDINGQSDAGRKYWLANTFQIVWAQSAAPNYFNLSFQSALTDSGADTQLITGGYVQSGGYEWRPGDVFPAGVERKVLTGFVTTVPPSVSSVPEVETCAMFLAGLGLIGAITRRRKGLTA